MNDIEHMAQFLPRMTTIFKTPDWTIPAPHAFVMEYVELKTEDVIAAFLGLQREAILEAKKLQQDAKRTEAIRRIRAMAHFK